MQQPYIPPFYSQRLRIDFCWSSFASFQFSSVYIFVSFNIENGYNAPDIEKGWPC